MNKKKMWKIPSNLNAKHYSTIFMTTDNPVHQISEEEYFIRKDEYIYGVGDDQFVDGSNNQVFSVNFYNSDTLRTGDKLRLKNLGCSKRYYQFMFLLLSQTADGAGGPFSTTPATVRGNIVNKSDEDNYPFGFFRLSETDTVEYTVTEDGGSQEYNE